MSARDRYPQLARLDKTNYVGIGADQTLDVQARRALDEIDHQRRLAELLAAALFIRGVAAKDCDALDEWLRT